MPEPLLPQTEKAIKTYQFRYLGSIFWLIFWLIFFFPIAFVLLLTDSCFQAGRTSYCVKYKGSRFWLGFWVLFFFPVAFLLLFIKGLTLTVDGED